MRQSRRMALCGLLTALTVVVLSLGSLVPLATFACPLLAMLWTSHQKTAMPT